MDGFTKRVLRIPVEKPFDEVYFTHRERMKPRITLKKKSDPGKFAIPRVVNLQELGNDLGYIVACHCGAEYKTEFSESIDTRTVSSIDSNESPTTDERYPTSLDGKQPSSWADSGFHESFAVDTVIPSSNEDPTEEYDEDYWKERATEIAMHDDRYSGLSFNNTCMPSSTRSNKDKHLLFSEDPAHLERMIHKDQRSTSLDAAAFTSTDSHTQPSTDTQTSSLTDLHRSTSNDTTPRTSIDHQSRNIVAIVILRQDENGNLYDQDGHLRNATGQKLDAQGNVNLVELGNDLGYIAACHCGAEYEIEYSESIDTHTASSIDSNESPTTNEHYPTSIDGKHPDHFTLPDQFYPDFAFQQPNKKGVMTIP
ncbi:hypothetical protein F2Q68_00021240 [Brassica cretica]|uniref:Uncharacterized protein n=1 Tax=Brassica cretica TaxID=69181 RepID=A0A8S9FTC3_BRACR|nr:hypothetical protein F2Q68_00021240 [Brassica cretica]